ncbi:MAG: hypothetical protein ACPH9O_08050 [Akkermansiaceae bacterium]
MSDHPKSPDFKKALILQGDWEAGLCNAALDLMDTGKQVTKVIFHAGDWIYKLKGVPCIKFDQPIDNFENWLRHRIQAGSIDCVVLYNQYRPYNQIGWDIARDLDIECLVFEQGLLRPDYCTIYSREMDQFNYLSKRWSSLPDDSHARANVIELEPLGRMSTPCKMVQFGLYYSFARFMTVVCRKYRHYVDQRKMNFRHHLMALVRGALRFQGRDKQKRFDQIFANEWSGKYYIAPLQVHLDSQITQRSNFQGMEQFIRKVSRSFLKNAPHGTRLIFKVHPVDRGYKDYTKLIKSLQAQAGGHRILYLDRIHLPTALDHARGCVTINSSVGLSALIHNTPVIALGVAAYDHDELCYQGELHSFWLNHGGVDRGAVRSFVKLLERTSQAHGTLYQRLYASYGHSKIVWPEPFKPLFDSEKGPKKLTRKPRSAARPPSKLEQITVPSN